MPIDKEFARSMGVIHEVKIDDSKDYLQGRKDTITEISTWVKNHRDSIMAMSGPLYYVDVNDLKGKLLDMATESPRQEQTKNHDE